MKGSSHSDSDPDDPTGAALDHDRDVFKEDFERDQLLADPSTLDGTNGLNFSKRDRRRLRRRERRKKSRQKDEAGSLMFEMEEGGGDDASTASSRSSMEPERPPSRWKKTITFCIIPTTILTILSLLVLGAYIQTRKSLVRVGKPLSLLSNGTSKFAPTTILVSLDGFRADFLNRNLTPTLNSFIAEGVSPKYMLPSFPSVTFPNHYTLVTGLYPESHGVVGNTFWDTDLQEEFFYTDPARSMQPKWWLEAEPLWVTASRQSIRSAIHMWPGSEAHIQIEPAFVDKFNGTEVLSRKVDRILNFVDLPSVYDPGVTEVETSRPQFIAFYVPNVDADGHLYGPNSTEIRTTINNVDSMLHDLLAGLQARNLSDIVNVVVVSDHGMATTSIDRLIQLEDLIDVNLVEHIDGWPLYGLRPRDPNDLRGLYNKLSAEAAKNPNFEVYLRDENMPERYHFTNNKRIAPLWIVPKTGWAIVTKQKFDVEEAKKTDRIFRPQGLHGYDHEHPLMRAIFVARGPAFPHQPNSRLEVFQNTEVYNIVCDSLGIQALPNNGTLRLPLQPIGLHSDKPEVLIEPAIDPPPSTPMSPAPTGTPEVGKDVEENEGEQDGEEIGMSDWWSFLSEKLSAVKDWATGLLRGDKGADSNSDDEDEDGED